MVDSVNKSEGSPPSVATEPVKVTTEFGENLMVIPATNQIKELQTIIRDK